MIALGLDEIVRAVGGKMPPGDRLSSRSVSVTGLSTDTRTIQPGEVFVALSGENFDGRRFVTEAFAQGARAALVAESTANEAGLLDPQPGPLILVNNTRTALGRLAVHYRKGLSAKVIAVTGSNGKTTTKGMIDHVLGTCLPGRAAQKSFNNDIGVPLTLLSAEPSDRYLVIEIGSSAPGEVAQLAAMTLPDIAVVTSIGHAHLEGFGGIDGVVREKLSLLEHVAPGGVGVVNLDDLTEPRPSGSGGWPRWPAELKTITFGTHPQADVRVTAVESGLDGVSFAINERYGVRLPVPGAHNAKNAAAAFTVARRMGLEPEQIAEALRTIELPEMRLQVHRLNGLTLVEDCYNANPSSMAAGIQVLRTVRARRRVLIAGEMMELGAQSGALHEQIGVLAARSGVDLVVAVGCGAGPIVDGARSFNQALAAHAFDTTEQACAEVPTMLASGDTVLLKGSRAMGLERLGREIAAGFASKPDGRPGRRSARAEARGSFNL